jgi:hypothetical protein
MSPARLSLIAVGSAVAALVTATVATILLFLPDEPGTIGIGETECDVYCGPQWAWLLILVLGPLTLMLWIAGWIIAIIAAAMTRGRSWLPWVVIAVSFVLPAAYVLRVSGHLGT